MTDAPIVRWQTAPKSRLRRALECAGAFAVTMLVTVTPFLIFAEMLK